MNIFNIEKVVAQEFGHRVAHRDGEVIPGAGMYYAHRFS